MIDASIVYPNGKRKRIYKNQWRDGWYETLLDLKVEKIGTHLVGVSTKAKIIELSAEDFNLYLAHDKVMDILAERKKNGETDKPARELYSKHIKTLVQVGDKRTGSFNTNLEYPIEIIPSQNPYNLKKGDEMGFQVLRDGKAVANQLVYASYAGFHGHLEDGSHEEAVTARTDNKGFGKGTFGILGIKGFVKEIFEILGFK